MEDVNSVVFVANPYVSMRFCPHGLEEPMPPLFKPELDITFVGQSARTFNSQ